MNVSKLLSEASKVFKENSPSILTALGVSGTLGTAYLTGVASWKAARRLSEGPADLTMMEKIEIVWDLYIPATIAGSITIGCIIGANQISSKRITAAYSVLAVTEKTLSEYKDKVIETYGERKEEALRAEIAQAKVSKNPPSQLVIIGQGTVLCCESYTGRYFNSDMESLRKAQNNINARLIEEDVSLLYFYHLIDIPETDHSGDVGWVRGELMELDFSTVMSDDNRPCIAFAYNYIKPLYM